MTASGPENANRPTFPRKNSVVALAAEMLSGGKIVEVFLGITRPQSLELGVGPSALVLLLIALAVPLALGGNRRRFGLFVAAQIWAQAVFWLAVHLRRTITFMPMCAISCPHWL